MAHLIDNHKRRLDYAPYSQRKRQIVGYNGCILSEKIQRVSVDQYHSNHLMSIFFLLLFPPTPMAQVLDCQVHR